MSSKGGASVTVPSPSNNRNSYRQRPFNPGTTTCGRFGSAWCIPYRSVWKSPSVSTTSHNSGWLRPVISMPRRERTVDRPPSHPRRYRAER